MDMTNVEVFIAVTFVPAAIPVVVEMIIPTAKFVTAVRAIVDELLGVLLLVVLRLKEQEDVMPVTANALAVVAAEEAPATAPKAPELTDNEGDIALPRIAAAAGSNCVGAREMAPTTAAIRASLTFFIKFTLPTNINSELTQIRS